MQRIDIRYQPPSNGWLTLRLSAEGRSIEIDASDVPNNPIQALVDALDSAAAGTPSRVWWNQEPSGYLMSFVPLGSEFGNEMEFRLEFSHHGEHSPSHVALALRGGRSEVLLPFWRFLREFQSHAYAEPHWPSVNYERLLLIKARIAGADEAS